MAIIVPCAGESSRYITKLPKYLLQLPDGKMMFEKCVENYLKKENIFFIIPKSHEKKFKSKTIIKKTFSKFKNVKIIEILNKTNGPAETIYNVAKRLNEFIFIQDCDSFFDVHLKKENFVSVVNLKDHLGLFNVASKSFAISDSQRLLKNIVEKDVKSNLICCGGYGFKSSKDYCKYFKKISNQQSEIFVSHIIKSMLLEEEVFNISISKNFIDLGTSKEYNNYKRDKSTFFVNLHGSFFYNYFNKFYSNETEEMKTIKNSLKFFKDKHDQGSFIFFYSYKSNKFKKIINKKIQSLGFKNFDLLMQVPNAPAILVKDYNNHSVYPNASCINAPSDSEEFWNNFSLND